MSYLPYEPPKALVADPAEPPSLPRAVRVLRAVAIAGNAVLGLLPLLVLFASTDARVFGFIAGILLVSGTSIAALVSRMAERLVFWSAMLLNGAAAAFFIYLFYFGRRSSASEWFLIFIVPALLNLVAISELRRARLRLKEKLGGP